MGDNKSYLREIEELVAEYLDEEEVFIGVEMAKPRVLGYSEAVPLRFKWESMERVTTLGGLKPYRVWSLVCPLPLISIENL